MATKVKPCRIKATGTPQAGYVPKYVDEDTFQWGAGGGGGGSDIEYVTQAEYNALLPGALTDGKHYFIYSTDGGGGWQPGVNTIAYYPLTSVSTTSDMSNNNYDLTNAGSATFGTYTTENIDCVYLNSNARNVLYNSSLGGQLYNTPFTYSFWMNAAQLKSGEQGLISVNNANLDDDRALAIMSNGTIRFYVYRDGTHFAYTSAINAGERHNIVATADGTNIKVYLDGVLAQTTSSGYSTGSTSTTFGIGTKYPGQAIYYDGYMSNVIVEDVARTAQEISDYYNQSKGDYGIS